MGMLLSEEENIQKLGESVVVWRYLWLVGDKDTCQGVVGGGRSLSITLGQC